MSRPAPADVDGPRILVSGWAGAGNIGDELLTRAVIAELRALGAHPVIASQDPEATALFHAVESVPWGPRGVRSIDDVDGVCVGPGGILQDSSSLWSLPGHLVVPLVARRRGLPVAAIGVGAEPLRRRSSAILLRRALAGRPVVTRDEASSTALLEAGLAPVTGADLVFGLEPSRGSAGDATPEIVVSVGGSVRPGLLAPAARRLEEAPIEEIAGALDHLAAVLDARVVLTSFRGERDEATAAALCDVLTADAVQLRHDVDEHVRRVCGARLVVSSRYHPIVLAARAGVPVFAVSDQVKVRALVAQLGRPAAIHVESWAAVGRLTSVPPCGSVAVVSGVERAREALTSLVHEAGALRGRRPAG